jgi:membrane-associated phospholipid phosphatase
VSVRKIIAKLQFQTRPRLGRKDFFIVAISFLIWIAGVELRPIVLQARCVAPLGSPSVCTPESVPFFDRPGLGLEDAAADGYSFNTQNAAGLFAASIPLLWNAGLVLTQTLTPALALSECGVHLVLFLETWGINGALTEVTRLMVQRPRPFVYKNPNKAADPQSYVSFYSGHTSFAAAATTYLLLILLCYGVPRAFWLTLLGLSEGLVISTAVFRILSGRHFLSDVIVGAFAGSLVAIFVMLAHDSKKSEN